MENNILFIGTLYGAKLRKTVAPATTGYAIQKYNQNMVNAIKAIGNVKVLSPVYTKKKISKKEYSNGIFYSYTRHSGIYGRIAALLSSVKNCLKHKNSVIISDALNVMMTLGVLMVKKCKNIKVILTVTDIPEDVLNKKNTLIANLFMRSLKNADGFIFLTEQTNVDFNSLKRPYILVEGIVSEVGIPSSTFKENICVYAGGLAEKNCIREMVDAFDAVAKENEQLLIFGDGTESCKEYVKSKTDQSKHIKYMGTASNEVVMGYEAKARLLINPRTNTGTFTKYSFPSKFIEYLNSGTAALVQPLDGVSDEYNNHAILFSGTTIEDYEKSIREALDKSNEELIAIGKKAQDFVREKNGYKATAKKIESLIRSLYNQEE